MPSRRCSYMMGVQIERDREACERMWKEMISKDLVPGPYERLDME